VPAWTCSSSSSSSSELDSLPLGLSLSLSSATSLGFGLAFPLAVDDVAASAGSASEEDEVMSASLSSMVSREATRGGGEAAARADLLDFAVLDDDVDLEADLEPIDERNKVRR
jgi:hypothetical protein